MSEGEALIERRDDQPDRIVAHAGDRRRRLRRSCDVVRPRHGEPGAVAHAQGGHDDGAAGEGQESLAVQRCVGAPQVEGTEDERDG